MTKSRRPAKHSSRSLNTLRASLHPVKLYGLESLEAKELLTADIVSFSPAAGATFVDSSTDLEVEFSKPVVAGAGNIVITSSSGTVVEMIDVTDASRVTVDGTSATINPSAVLSPNGTYSISIDDGAFKSQTAPFFTEDFEDVGELFEFESEGEGNGDGTDWTDELPDGWERDNTDTPDGGPIEFFGFNVFDKNSWIATAGDQGRSNFTLGTGNVMVMDPDEYDDLGDVDPDQINVFLTSPEISLEGQAANSVQLEFDSSFRPYPTMVGTVDVSFDGGSSWDNLLTLTDDTVEGGTSSMARANVREVLPISNPAGGTAMIRFAMTDAGNDWWWAFDNVTLETPSDDGPAVSGLSGDTWSWTTSPGFSPTTGSVDVSTNGNLSVEFDVDVKLTPGQGNIEIRRAADDSVFEVIPVSSSQVTASGKTVTIDPVSDFEPNTEYYVLIDDFAIYDTQDVAGPGITFFLEDFEDLPMQDSGLVGGNDTNDYLVVMEGVLDVKVAGEYTFGGNSDDGQLFVIDIDGDGIDDVFSEEVLIEDDATHGTEDRLSTCDPGQTQCIGNGFQPLDDLEVGQYAFQYWFFERSGGSGGELFYAPGYYEEFVPGEFALVGDDSMGIGVTAEGITATTYKANVQDDTIDTINSIGRSLDLLEGIIPLEEGFPATETIEFADIYDSGGSGRFPVNNTLPGVEPPEGSDDFSPVAPEGWTRESTIEDLGAAPEYNGWTFLNKEFWIAEQGNQDRSTFTKGDNVLAVIDPDAADDYVEIGGDGQEEEGIFDGWLATQPISLEGVEAEKVTLQFDSSFRPYPTMVGGVEVSFDEGDSWDRLLTLDEDTVEGGTSSLARANATESLEVNNPGSGTVMFRWTMEDAGNDWWWAIDNIRLTTPFTGNPISGVRDIATWAFTTGDGGGSELIPGDIDGDGSVGFPDFLILSGQFSQAADPAGSGADLDGDGEVGFPDFLLLSANFGRTAAVQANADAVAAVFAESFVAEASETEAGDDDDSEGEDLLAQWLPLVVT